MSYRIEKGESLGVAFGRIAAEEIEMAMGELRGGHRNDGAAVHNARKALKRLRALLRSLRVLPEKLYREESHRFAEAGRKISPMRDLQAQLRALRKLPSGAARTRLREGLLRRQRRFGRQMPALRRAVRDMLQQSMLIDGVRPARQPTPARLAAGLKRIYKKGRSCHKAACQSPTVENLHEWRKRVKSLGFGFRSSSTAKRQKQFPTGAEALRGSVGLFGGGLAICSWFCRRCAGARGQPSSGDYRPFGSGVSNPGAGCSFGARSSVARNSTRRSPAPSRRGWIIG